MSRVSLKDQSKMDEGCVLGRPPWRQSTGRNRAGEDRRQGDKGRGGEELKQEVRGSPAGRGVGGEEINSRDMKGLELDGFGDQ